MSNNICLCAEKLQFVNISVVKDDPKITKVIVRFYGTSCCDVTVDNYLSSMKKVYADKIPFVILYDATQIGRVSLGTINKMAKFMREFDEATNEFMLRCAITLSSEWARAALKMLFVIKPPACKELDTFTTLKKAKSWLAEITIK
jgi:hypothetical protein